MQSFWKVNSPLLVLSPIESVPVIFISYLMSFTFLRSTTFTQQLFSHTLIPLKSIRHCCFINQSTDAALAESSKRHMFYSLFPSYYSISLAILSFLFFQVYLVLYATTPKTPSIIKIIGITVQILSYELSGFPFVKFVFVSLLLVEFVSDPKSQPKILNVLLDLPKEDLLEELLEELLLRPPPLWHSTDKHRISMKIVNSKIFFDIKIIIVNN